MEQQQATNVIRSTVSKRERQVTEFQQKMGCHAPRRIDASCPEAPFSTNELAIKHVEDALLSAVTDLEIIERRLSSYYNDYRDPRLIRGKLMVSELGEVIEALANRDEIELADGLADLEYVTVGTATTFSIPLGPVFDEVHRSNMTKHTVESAVRNHSGDRGKGPGYEPPDVRGVIERSRRSEYVASSLVLGEFKDKPVLVTLDDDEPSITWQLPSGWGPDTKMLVVREDLNSTTVETVRRNTQCQ